MLSLWVPTLRPRVNPYGPKVTPWVAPTPTGPRTTVSTIFCTYWDTLSSVAHTAGFRGLHLVVSEPRLVNPGHGRVQPSNILIGDPVPDPPPPVDPPAPEVPHVPRGLFDENLDRQFLQLIQGAVRAANVVPEVPISQTLISSGVRTFTSSPDGAPTDAEDWLRDTERRMDQLGFDPAKKYQGAVSMLDGNAHVWWESVVTIVPDKCLLALYFRMIFTPLGVICRELISLGRTQKQQDLDEGSCTEATPMEKT
ncbi:hypothetical protein V6N12_047411 [Hibiscus sabdariffa]|uniref:Uncharacterized protein n=1 Tax=Hibiscus sabdariffa TaxID=183260 RepID=A0ABR2DAT7_9ROSI